MKKHIPNFLTCCNVLIGAIGTAYVSITTNYDHAIFFVLISAFLDLFDGLTARLLKVQSEFGKQLDSLADLISFGVLPAMALTIASLNYDFFDVLFGANRLNLFSLLVLLIVPFSALRLAKFNVSTNQSNEFRGLPTPANALMIVAFLLGGNSFFSPHFPLLITVVSCFLLVSNIRMIAFKFKSKSWAGNELRYLLLILLIAGFVVFQLSFIPFVIPTYIVFSIVGNYFLQPVLFK